MESLLLHLDLDIGIHIQYQYVVQQRPISNATL